MVLIFPLILFYYFVLISRMLTKYLSPLIYGIDASNNVVLGSNEYDYIHNNTILNLLKEHKKVVFDNVFNASIEWLPEGITHIQLGTFFNQPLQKLPSTLKSLIIKTYNEVGATYFNNSLNNLPHGLEILEIHYNHKFNKDINNLPQTLKRLYMHCKACKINFNMLPNSLEHIIIYGDNNVINPINTICTMPTNLQSIKMCNYRIDLDNLEKLQFSNFRDLRNEYPNIYFIYLDTSEE